MSRTQTIRRPPSAKRIEVAVPGTRRIVAIEAPDTPDTPGTPRKVQTRKGSLTVDDDIAVLIRRLCVYEGRSRSVMLRALVLAYAKSKGWKVEEEP